jgi:hypothetical protein
LGACAIALKQRLLQLVHLTMAQLSRHLKKTCIDRMLGIVDILRSLAHAVANIFQIVKRFAGAF